MKIVRQRPHTDGSIQFTDFDAGWTMEEHFEDHAGTRIVTTLKIYPTQEGQLPAGGITARLLRQLRLGRFAELLRQEIDRAYGAGVGREFLNRAGWRASQAASAGRRRRPALFYAEIARDYVRIFMESGGRETTAKLAKKRRVTPEQMRNYVHAARRYGFLGKTIRGRAGGELTGLAMETLNASRDVERDHQKNGGV